MQATSVTTQMLSGKDDASASYQPTPEESQRLQLVTSRFDIAHTNQWPYFTDFDRYYKMYESYVNEQKSIWQTKIFIPIVFSVVERFLPRILANKPTVNYMARRPDTVDKAQNMQALFDWQWEQVARLKDGGMYLEMLRFVKDALIVGTAFAKIPWVSQTRQIKGYNKDGEVETKNKRFFDGPSFEFCDPYDIFFDPESTGVQQAQWIIHRTRRTLTELQEINAAKGNEIYKNLSVLEDMAGDILASSENDFKYRRKTALGNGQQVVYDKTTNKYELLECWGMFPKLDKNGKPTKDQELEPRVVTVAGRNVVIRDVPYPYWHGKKPFIAFTPFPRNFEMYGIALTHHIERIQFYTNEFVSQKFDNQVIELNAMIVVDPAANVEDWQLAWRPGGVIRAHPEYIKPLPLGDVTGNIDGSLNYLSEQVQLTTGLSDYYSSGANAQTAQNKTAAGANMIEEQMSTRVMEAVTVLEEQVIKELGYQWHGLDGQFIKLPQVIRVVGDNGKHEFPLVMPEDIRNDYDVQVETGSTQAPNQALMRAQFTQMIGMIQANPAMSAITDWQAVEQEMFNKFGIKNADKFMTGTKGSTQQGILGQNGQPQTPGQPGQAPQTAGNLMQQTAQGGIQPPQGGQAPGQPAPKMPGTVATKFTDLTLNEQKQWLQDLGIQADMQTRTENFAEQRDAQKHQKAMDMIKQNQLDAPQLPDMPPIAGMGGAK